MSRLYLNTSGLACMLGVNPTTVRRWIKKGLPIYREGNGGYIFHLGDVYIWLLIQHRASKTDEWGPRYRKISAYMNADYNGELISFNRYVYEKRIELGLNGPKHRKESQKTLYDANELARILNISPRTVYSWIRKYPDFPVSRSSYRKVAVMRLEEVYTWMDYNPKQSIWRKYRLELEGFIRTNMRGQNDLYGGMLTLKHKEDKSV